MTLQERLNQAMQAMEVLQLKPAKTFEASANYTIGKQTVTLRIDDYRAPEAVSLSVWPDNSRQELKDIYVNGKDYHSIKAKISLKKSTEQIAKEISRRILNSPEFTQNEAYLSEQLARQERHNSELDQNKAVFGENFLFNRGSDNTSASIFNHRQDGKYLSVKVDVSSALNYCTMELRGLTKDEWMKVLDVLNPIIESTKNNTEE